jgi:putative transposase
VTTHSYRLLAFVLMPEHVHLLVQPKRDASHIPSLLFAIKRPASFQIKRYVEQKDPSLLQSLMIRQRPGVVTFRFWQEGPGYDRNLTEPAAILTAMEYLHLNPVRRGLCERAIDWKWSSARYYLLPSMPQDPDLPSLAPLPPDLLT